ncbi:penicillin acylase family protein [Colwellia asteriadis]
MKKFTTIITRITLALMLILTLAVATLGTWLYSRVDGALAQLTGKSTVFGLSDVVTVERDKQGIPTIKAKNRVDIAVATGFIHAQERFFQMDLLRRNSAGELASLFGEIALNYDKSVRRHRFRDRARTIVSQLPDDQLALLKGYTRGVNRGLSALRADPFEYLLLQQAPVQWSEEDSVLTIFSMYLDLQSQDGKRERTLGLLNSVLSSQVYNFLNPKGSQWDATIDGTNYAPAPLPTLPWPSATANNLFNNPLLDSINSLEAFSETSNKLLAASNNDKYQDDEFPGSNNWAVSGDISQSGSAIIANDMHLGISVPNTWFRAVFEYSHLGKLVKITGATLPGTPNMVIGSNTHIAWGFTNSYGDFNDVITLQANKNGKQYLTPDGYKDFTYHKQVIAIKGKPAQEINIKETIWGPVIGKDHQGNLLAYRWVAHDRQAINFYATALELSENIDQAFDVAARSGIPSQNMMVGDSSGNIGWTIMGPIPKRGESTGEVPSSWSKSSNHWQGYLAPNDYPRIKNPKSNRLWTANSRVVGGENLQKIGNGGYALGARAQQIKDNLFSLNTFDEPALLAIALDDRALFLKRWHQFILDKVLTDEALAQHNDFAQIKALLIRDSNLSANTDSVAYRLVRNFRLTIRDQVFSRLNDSLLAIDPSYSFNTIRHQIETPLWQLITEKPDNFLMLPEESWSALFTKALQQTFTDMTQLENGSTQSLLAATWGQQNTTNIQHPLSKAVPILGYWLDMPEKALSGDSYMPKVQGKSFGASQRMVVSPGHEEQGIFHMPTSQAGHPWSTYYGMGHKDWEQGNPSSFLPGKTKYTLTLLSY